ncbi:MAG: Flp family type IVb pilin [Pseudomonadota bacterium]
MPLHRREFLRGNWNFKKEESGATSIEYALIAALIGFGIIAGFSQLGVLIKSSLWCVRGRLRGNESPSCAKLKGD